MIDRARDTQHRHTQTHTDTHIQTLRDMHMTQFTHRHTGQQTRHFAVQVSLTQQAQSDHTGHRHTRHRHTHMTHTRHTHRHTRFDVAFASQTHIQTHTYRHTCIQTRLFRHTHRGGITQTDYIISHTHGRLAHTGQLAHLGSHRFGDRHTHDVELWAAH